MRKKVVVSWSSGKDSAYALYKVLQQAAEYEIVGLLTTITEDYDRVSMHATQRSLLLKQAEMMGLPLYELLIPSACTMEIYERKMQETLIHIKRLGINHIIFGD